MRYDAETLTKIALTVFRERGFDGTSIVHIAAAAGLTKSSLYHHVAGKDELLQRGLDRALDALFEVLGESGATTGRPVDRLMYVIRRAVETELVLLDEVTVLVRTRGNTQVEREARERRRQFDGVVADIVREAQQAGEVRGDVDAALLSRLILGTANGITEWYQPGGAIPAEDVVRAVVQMIFEGICV